MKILVVGSTNIDHVSYIESFPHVGETIKTTKYLQNLGGKGANQALAIAKLSNKQHQIFFFSHIGAEEKNKIVAKLTKQGINCRYLFPILNVQTGVANIFVSHQERDNFIAVSPLANECFVQEAQVQLVKAIANCDYVLLQLEVNHNLISKTIALAKQMSKKIILNPSPISELDIKNLKDIDWLILNETELEYLTNINISNLQMLDQQIKIVQNYGVKNIIITLGSNGCFVASKSFNGFLKPHQRNIKVVDATAAGDTFIGGFVAQLTAKNQKQAILFAMQAAELAIQKVGAQISIPTYEEVKNAQTWPAQ